MQKPFDNLPAVTELIRLYTKEKKSLYELATYFDTTHHMCKKILKLHGVTIERRGGRRKDWIFTSTRYFKTEKKVDRRFKEQKFTPIEIPHSVGKYSYLIEEPINKGHDYADILKKQGYKKPKMDSFQRIRSFKEKNTP